MIRSDEVSVRRMTGLVQPRRQSIRAPAPQKVTLAVALTNPTRTETRKRRARERRKKKRGKSQEAGSHKDRYGMFRTAMGKTKMQHFTTPKTYLTPMSDSMSYHVRILHISVMIRVIMKQYWRSDNAHGYV